MYTTQCYSAEIDQLKKIQAAKPMEKKLEQIPRPTKFTSLQDAMGLSEDKRLYLHCRVSHDFPILHRVWIIITIVDCSRCPGTFDITI